MYVSQQECESDKQGHLDGVSFLCATLFIPQLQQPWTRWCLLEKEIGLEYPLEVFVGRSIVVDANPVAVVN